MKKLFFSSVLIVSLTLGLYSCKDADVLTVTDTVDYETKSSETQNSLVLEFVDMEETTFEPTRLDGVDYGFSDVYVSEQQNLSIKYDGKLMSANIAMIKGSEVDRYIVYGADNVAYYFVDVKNELNGSVSAKFYLYNGDLFMETSLNNNLISINEIYEEALVLNRAPSWFRKFAQCIDNTMLAVASDPALGAVAVVGGYCCAGYMLAGLGIGCAIGASL